MSVFINRFHFRKKVVGNYFIQSALNTQRTRDYQFRDVYLLSVTAEDEDSTDKGAVKGLQGWIDCFEKAHFAGKVFAGGFTTPKEIEGSDKLKEAYEMEKAIQ